MKKIAKIMAGVLATASVFACASCKKDQGDLDYIKEKNVLRVGITVYEPMDYYN